MSACNEDMRKTVRGRKGDQVSTRMAIPAECWRYGFSRSTIVLVVRRANGRELVFAADKVSVVFE